VATVAERPVCRPLAAAEISGTRFFRREGNRLKTGSLVGAIAEWLILAAPAGTPMIGFPLRNVDGVGRFLCNYGFVTHGVSSVDL